jgi:hypothetical protein
MSNNLDNTAPQSPNTIATAAEAGMVREVKYPAHTAIGGGTPKSQRNSIGLA